MASLLRECMDEIHLYVDKRELLIKDIIWAISWIGGIYAINNTEDKQALSSAYLIFALSLLMEFGQKIITKKHWFSRLVDSIFCLAIISILLMAIVSLFGAPLLCESHYKIMFIISLSIMVFMILDFIITWIEPEINQSKPEKHAIIENNDNTIALFNNKLYKGKLGDISKGDDTNE